MRSFETTPIPKVESPAEPAKHPWVDDQMCQGSLNGTSTGGSCVLRAESDVECHPSIAGDRTSLRRSSDVHSPAKNLQSNTCQVCSLALLFPEKLYDREQESKAIFEAFERSCSSQTSNNTRGELLLITGSSGTGKTSLADSVLRRKVEIHDGTYADGKFDLSERREQFYAIVQAMGACAKALEKLPIDRLNGVRTQLASQKESVRVFLDLCPKLSALLNLEAFIVKNDDASYTAPLSQYSGSSCTAESIDSGDAFSMLRSPSSRSADSSVTLVTATRERLKQGIRDFFAAVCSPTYPVVFFLDDLQWAEPASLDLLSSLIVDRIPGLLVVGACRHDEVDPTTSHLSVLLREIESMKATVTQVVVSNVGPNGLSSMLLDSPFHMVRSKAQALARLVLEKTNGNMLFVLLVLNFLVHEGLIYRPGRSWTFNCEEDIQRRLEKSYRFQYQRARQRHPRRARGSRLLGIRLF
jgi:predicted ATPase